MCVLLPGKIYHIYNHAVGEERLFRHDGNYLFFLKRYADFIHPVAHTYAYCLVPDHFHLMIRIRSEEELCRTFPQVKASSDLEDFKNLEGLTQKVTRQFSNFFNAYSKAYNKYYSRKGALFCHNFKRKEIINALHYPALVLHIHRNPVYHRFCNSINEWRWSSYHTYLNTKHTLLQKEETLKWFSGKKEFTSLHKEEIASLVTEGGY